MTISFDVPDPDDKHRPSDAKKSAERFSSIAIIIDRPDVLWYMAKNGKLDRYESPDPEGGLANSGIYLTYSKGELLVDLKMKISVRDLFIPSDKQQKRFLEEVKKITEGEIACEWDKRAIEIKKGNTVSTLSWPEPNGFLYDSEIQYKTSVSNNDGINEFENALQTALELFRAYAGYGHDWAEKNTPKTSLLLRPPASSIAELKLQKKPSTELTLAESKDIAIAEQEESYRLKPISYKEEDIRRALSLTRSQYSLDDIIDMPDAVKTLTKYLPILTTSTEAKPLVADRPPRRIIIIEGESHERSAILINGLAGSISAKAVFAKQDISTTDKVAELKDIYNKYQRYYDSKFDETESRRTLLVLTVPDEEYGTEPPFLSQATADDLYRAFDDDNKWKDTIVVFVANSSKDLQPSIQQRALVTVSSDDRGTDYSRLILSKLLAMTNQAKDVLKVETMNHRRVANKLYEDGCNKYSDVIDALEKSLDVAIIRSRKNDPDAETIIITEDDILSAWTLVKLGIDTD